LITKKQFLILFLLVFLFRLAFGLLQASCQGIDQLQTYLIGLKCYTTGTWPYFGPDVNGNENLSFQSQVPGALEGLLIGLPFYLLPEPEAPFIVLNFLSTLGIALLTWYICKRLPGISYPWLFLWISIAPWSLHEATHVLNPSYIFFPSILFFVGFLESTPLFSLNLIPSSLANALMGFSLFWIMQFHLSYVYLLPLIAFSLAIQLKKTRQLGCLFYFILGSLPTLVFLIPTYVKYGLARNDVASGFVVPFNPWYNFMEFVTIIARFLSLVSFEMPRFIGDGTKTRFAYLNSHAWLWGPGGFLWIAGYIQPFVFLFGWFRKDSVGPHWRNLKFLVLAVWLMVEVSFCFTTKLPLTHIYFVFFPLVMIYSCYCWVCFSPERHWRLLAQVFLILGVFFQISYALTYEPQNSLYAQREPMARAIHEKNYHLMGERRPGSLY
jgi:hypothetical protein